jgi:deoxyribonuclease-4
MFGSHLSIAGSMLNALDEARSLGLDTVQVFTKNQQQWACKPLPTDAVLAWRARIDELGWADRTVSHASYLINLASPDDALWAKSIDLMHEEIRRCDVLGIPLLVHHPGAHTTGSVEQGLDRIARAYQILMTRTENARVVSCLENTVGSGSNLGGTFTQLADLRDRIIALTDRPDRVGVCIDTCHAHAAGYDLAPSGASRRVIDQMDREIGLDWVRVLHLNDSKAPAGSRRDLHAHIGEGTIGLPGFEGFVTHPAFRATPKILETPKGLAPDGTPLDTVNLRRLYSLVSSRPIMPGDPGGSTPAARPASKRSPPKVTRAGTRGRPKR